MNAPADRRSAAFPLDWCRGQFPALARQHCGRPAVFFDGPAGSQVPQAVIDALSHYLVECNANHGGRFVTSRESNARLDAAHQGLADFCGSGDAGTIAFGPNMTTLTFALSRALAREWRPGDEILVTRLDHDANVTPWVLAARDAGATVRHVGIRAQDCTLDLDDLDAQLSPRTRLVAVGCASNAVGTINPVAEIARRACRGRRGVRRCGAFRAAFAARRYGLGLRLAGGFGVQVLWPALGRAVGPGGARLESLPAYKLRPAPDDLPGRWMTGTQSHEAICGALAAVEYLAELGRQVEPSAAGRRPALVAAYRAIGAYERQLAGRLISGLGELARVKLYGIAAADRLGERVPTVAIRHDRLAPAALAEYLNARGIFVWHGNFYALPLTEALGLEPEGLVRIGLLHYNTAAEVERLLAALAELET